MRCLVCKSDTMIDSKSTYFAQLDNCYIIIDIILFICYNMHKGIYI